MHLKIAFHQKKITKSNIFTMQYIKFKLTHNQIHIKSLPYYTKDYIIHKINFPNKKKTNNKKKRLNCP